MTCIPANLLELRSLHKSFGSTKIIRGVDLEVKPGERHALIGPNGAGKSTLFNLISGHYIPTSGAVILNQNHIEGMSPHLINRRGLSRSFQITSLFQQMTVAENLRIAAMGRQGYRLNAFRPVSRLSSVNEAVDICMEKLRLTRRRNDRVGDLAYSDQRALEIGMSLATDPKILLLDEPTAGMSNEETAYIMELIRDSTNDRTLLVVEHDMSVVFGLCDRISVLVYGHVLASGTPEEVRQNHLVQEAYLGEEAFA